MHCLSDSCLHLLLSGVVRCVKRSGLSTEAEILSHIRYGLDRQYGYAIISTSCAYLIRICSVTINSLTFKGGGRSLGCVMAHVH